MKTDADVITHAKEAALALGWEHPFFLVPLSYASWEVSDKIATMAVSARAEILINPDFARSISRRELAGVVFHEVLHVLLGHHERQGARDPQGWAVATDQAINATLRTLRIALPQGALYPAEGDENLSADELYSRVTDEDRQRAAAGRATAGCGVLVGEPPPDGDAGPNWAEVLIQAHSTTRGTEAARVLGGLFARPAPRVAWRSLLRATVNQVAASGGRDMQVCSRRSRRSPPGIILPGWTSHRPRVAVVIDTSGSVSDEMIGEALAEVRAISKVSGCMMFVALHDAECYWSGWLAPGADPSRKITGRGGTCAHAAYLAVKGAGAKFDALIHLTDGEIRWPEKPSNSRRWVLGILGDREGHTAPPTSAQLVRVAF